MSRSIKDVRRALAPLTGLPPTGDLLKRAVPNDAPRPLAEKVKERQQQIRNGYPGRIR